MDFCSNCNDKQAIPPSSCCFQAGGHNKEKCSQTQKADTEKRGHRAELDCVSRHLELVFGRNSDGFGTLNKNMVKML